MTYFASTRPKPLTQAEREARKAKQKKLRQEAAKAHTMLQTGSRVYRRSEVLDIFASLSIDNRFSAYAE